MISDCQVANKIEYTGSSICQKDKIRILPEVKDKFGRIQFKQPLQYIKFFDMQISLRYSKADPLQGNMFLYNNENNGMQFQLIRQHYAEQNQHEFLGADQSFQGFGFYLQPIKSQNEGEFKLQGHYTDGAHLNIKDCNIQMKNGEDIRLRLQYSYQNVLTVFKYQDKFDSRGQLCFSLKEDEQAFKKVQLKQFYLLVSAKNTGSVFSAYDLTSIHYMSDFQNHDPELLKVDNSNKQTHHKTKDIIRHHGEEGGEHIQEDVFDQYKDDSDQNKIQNDIHEYQHKQIFRLTRLQKDLEKLQHQVEHGLNQKENNEPLHFLDIESYELRNQIEKFIEQIKQQKTHLQDHSFENEIAQISSNLEHVENQIVMYEQALVKGQTTIKQAVHSTEQIKTASNYLSEIMSKETARQKQILDQELQILDEISQPSTNYLDTLSYVLLFGSLVLGILTVLNKMDQKRYHLP